MSKNRQALTGCLIIVAFLFLCGIVFVLIPTPSDDADESTERGETSSVARSNTVSATAIPSSTPVPSATPVPTPDAVSLPLEIKSSSGWTLTVESIEQFPSIEAESKRYRPENGIFAVFIGTLGNFSDEDGCLEGDKVVIVDSSGKEYEMDSDLLDELKSKYERDYPGFFLGQCLDYDATEETFLVFDVPNNSSLSLKLEGTSAHLGKLEAYESVAILHTPTPSREHTQTPLPVATQTPAPASTQVSGTNSLFPTTTPRSTDIAVSVAQAVLNVNANLRSGPGTDFEVVGTGTAGETYPVYARTPDGWLLLDTIGDTWVASSLTTLETEQSIIPIWDGQPIESGVNNSQPAPISGIGVSLNDFVEVFALPDGLFEFEPPSELINGEQRVFAQTPDTTAILELIGPPTDLYQATLITGFPTNDTSLVEVSVITAAFVKVAIPSWGGASDWFMDNILEASQTDGKASTVHDDKVLEITIIKELGIIMFGVRAEGYGE